MLDAYTRRARITPAVIAAAPALAFMVAGGFNLDTTTGIISLMVGAAGIIAAGLTRDAGYRLQAGLWQSWGGSPTVRRLRWRESTNPTLVRRLHDDISRLIGHRLPTAEHEAQDPVAADSEYDAAIAVLRQRTGDTKTFNKVFAENMEYGFRRNCLGLRRVGLALSTIGVITSTGLIIWTSGELPARLTDWGMPGLVSVAAALFWWLMVTPAWVRQPAETYADRLLEAVATLKQPQPQSRVE